MKTLFLIVLLFCVGACDNSNQLSESERRAVVSRIDFEDLKDYCELLDHLYQDPSSDSKVVEMLERLVMKKTLIVRAVHANPNDFGWDAIEALLAVLALSEKVEFGGALNNPLVLGPNIEYLREIEPEMKERLKYLQSIVRVD